MLNLCIAFKDIKKIKLRQTQADKQHNFCKIVKNNIFTRTHYVIHISMDTGKLRKPGSEKPCIRCNYTYP